MAALRLAFSAPPDLMLLDVGLPGLDGLTVLDQVRASAQTSNLPVILVSSGVHELVSEGLRRGTNAYITKPFQLKTLLTTIEQLLGPQ
jgi:DNA-binding response OmpR family regulator